MSLYQPGYQVILADCPWSYREIRTGGSFKSGAAAQYRTMPLQAICDLPVGQVADVDSVLFLWATVPLLPEALLVMQAWGYTYKTKINWDKDIFGLGHWFRGDHEDLLVGVRGDVRPFKCQHRNRVKAKGGKHSAKPNAVRELVALATKRLPGRRLELFAREQVTGWTCLGDEIDGQDIRDSLPKLGVELTGIGSRWL